jgi:hypothetical protein
MRKIFALLMIIAMAIIGIAFAEDYIKVTDTPIKDLGNLSLDEIDAIFSGGDSWFMNAGPSQYTPSQMGFLKNNEEDGEPIGNVTPKHAYVGSVNRPTS